MGESEWRSIRKFPGYEVSDSEQIRSSSTKRIIPQRHTLSGPIVLLNRNGWNTECFVHEMFLLAFPEIRGETRQYSIPAIEGIGKLT